MVKDGFDVIQAKWFMFQLETQFFGNGKNGTKPKLKLFEDEFRIARRLTGSKEVLWNPMKNDDTFRLFLEGIWRYQWIRNYTPLSDELISAVFEETQGISDLVVKLFIYSQQFAIERRLEVITPELIRKVAKDNFRLMKPMIDALRTANPYKISQYSDLRLLETKERITTASPVPSTKKETPITKKETRSTVPTPIAAKPKTNGDYRDGDLRRSFRVAKQENVPPETVLVKEGYIDDMTFWIDGGNQ